MYHNSLVSKQIKVPLKIQNDIFRDIVTELSTEIITEFMGEEEDREQNRRRMAVRPSDFLPQSFMGGRSMIPDPMSFVMRTTYRHKTLQKNRQKYKDSNPHLQAMQGHG